MSEKQSEEKENPAEHAGAPKCLKATGDFDFGKLYAELMMPVGTNMFEDSCELPSQYASVVKLKRHPEIVDDPERTEAKIQKHLASWLGESPKVDFVGFGQAKKSSPPPPPLPPPPLPVDWPTHFKPKFNPTLAKMDFPFPKFDFKRFGLDDIDAEPPPPPPPVEEQARQLAAGLRARRQARAGK